MNELSQTMQELPLAGMVPVALAAIIGLLLWAAGRRLLRTGFAAAGFVLGGAIGWILADHINVGVPSWVAGLAAAIIVASVAALTYRLAVAAALAIVLAVASPMAVIAVHELQDDAPATAQTQPEDTEQAPADTAEPDDSNDDEELDEIDRWLNDRILEQLPGGGEGLEPQSTEQLTQQFAPEMSEHVDQVKSYAEKLVNAGKELWQSTPESIRPMLIAAMVIGALLGLLIGALVPGLSASVVTAFGGGMLWLSAVRIGAERFAEGAFMPETTRTWLVLWLVLSVIGLCIQWMFRTKQADNSQRR